MTVNQETASKTSMVHSNLFGDLSALDVWIDAAFQPKTWYLEFWSLKVKLKVSDDWQAEFGNPWHNCSLVLWYYLCWFGQGPAFRRRVCPWEAALLWAPFIHLAERKHAQLMWATQNCLNLLNQLGFSAAQGWGWGDGNSHRAECGHWGGKGKKRLLDIMAWQLWVLKSRRLRETKGIQACRWRKTTLTQQAGYF